MTIRYQDKNTMKRKNRQLVLSITILFFFLWLLYYAIYCRSTDTPRMMAKDNYSNENKAKKYDRNMPLIFIGGFPGSGTTLMRAMLDAHPEVRCEQETKVIPLLLQLREHWANSPKESLRLEEAGISKQVLDSAITAFLLEVILHNGDPAPRLCNKEPLTLNSAVYLSELFPKAKFIFMVRDGRATVHSVISRKIVITGFCNVYNYRQCMIDWNFGVEEMYTQCHEVGRSRCLMVPYEQLVLHPSEWMHKILQFLEVPWNDSVLHPEEHINKPGGVSLSKKEISSVQVIKPIYLDALAKWVGNIPEDVIRDMAKLAPMMSTLGYDLNESPPSYVSPDTSYHINEKQL